MATLNLDKKIKTKEEIKKLVETMRIENSEIKIVTTNGAFDILHSGHIRSLELAKSYGDILIVGLNSDASVKRYKSPLRPIIPQKERAQMLAALECVNYVVIFDEDDPRNLLEAIKPTFHVKSKTGFKGIEREVVESSGGKIILVEDIAGISTSEIIAKIIKTYNLEQNSK
jgi:D-beta-D-heptose 7-phosphate kinase/D-beta-D-heptose 1-phosphate adenosyltransferase